MDSEVTTYVKPEEIGKELLQEAMTHIKIARRKNRKMWAWNEAEIAVDLVAKAGFDVRYEILGKDNYPDCAELERVIRTALNPSFVVVSRHDGAVDWLKRRGYDVSAVITGRATGEQISGKNVVGNLPMRLAALADSIAVIEIPGRPTNRMGDELTADEMEQFGAYIRRFRVTELS